MGNSRSLNTKSRPAPWEPFRRVLMRYEGTSGPMRRLKLPPGKFVIARFFLIIACVLAAWSLLVFQSPLDWILKLPLYLIAFGAIMDILIVNTVTAFLSEKQGRDPLRSAVLLVFSYTNLALAFSVLYLLNSEGFDRTLDNPIDAIYYSFVTLSTLGYGDIKPIASPAELLVVSNVILHFFFVGLLVKTIMVVDSKGSPTDETKGLSSDGKEPEN